MTGDEYLQPRSNGVIPAAAANDTPVSISLSFPLSLQLSAVQQVFGTFLLKPGFHYPSSWSEFTGQVDDP